MKCTPLLAILLVGCTWNDVTPDSFTLGYAYTDYDYSQGLGVDWNPDRLTNLDGGDSSTVFASLGWKFGAARPPSQAWMDFERSLALDRARAFAEALPEVKPPVINVQAALGVPPLEVDLVEEPSINWWWGLEWFAHATLMVQIFTFVTMLAVLTLAYLCRKTLLQMAREIVSFRWGKNRKKGGK